MQPGNILLLTAFIAQTFTGKESGGTILHLLYPPIDLCLVYPVFATQLGYGFVAA